MESPEHLIGEILRKKKLTISAAESCTGGRFGDKMTNVSGSSDYFFGSVVAYSNAAKMRILGVKKKTLTSHGAVSEQVATEMAIGCRRAFGSDIGVSTTGIAGPTGGSKEKPVGLVWFGVTDGKQNVTDRVMFSGDRLDIKESAANHAIELIIDFIRKS